MNFYLAWNDTAMTVTSGERMGMLEDMQLIRIFRAMNPPPHARLITETKIR